MSPPPAHSEDLGLDRKRKCAGEASALEDEEELFDILDS
jgi:hypothetical protein